jgi:hypothetical protein
MVSEKCLVRVDVMSVQRTKETSTRPRPVRMCARTASPRRTGSQSEKERKRRKN